MKSQINKNALIIAAVAGLSTVAMAVWPSSAKAQYIVQNGHANDANHQIGSGGYNYGGGNPNRLSNNQLQTDIITGNVSGLNYFHGNTNGEFNTNVFSGNVGTGNSDRLNAIVGPTAGSGGTQYQVRQGPTPTPFYSTQSLTSNAPQGLAPTGTNNKYLVPAPTVDPLVPDSDTRLDPGQNLSSNPAVGNVPLPGELQMEMIGGPVDPSGVGSVYTSMSPLYGVQTGNAEDSFYQSKFGSQTRPQLGGSFDNSKAAQIQRMRDELNNNIVSPNPQQQPGNGPGTPPGTTPNNMPDNARQVPGATPLPQGQLNAIAGNGSSLTPGQLNDTVGNQQLNNTTLSSGQGMQNNLLIPPADQSDTLKRLELQYKGKNGKLTNDEQTERFNAEKRAQANETKSDLKPLNTDLAPATPMLENGGGAIKQPDSPAPSPAHAPILNNDDASAISNKPVIITSLADGIRAKGLASVMKTGEEKLRQGKFTEAVASYETAQQVAPNNPFVYLGRSFAELGSSYYGKADLDLRRAVLLDPAVLAGHYDLNGFLGQERVGFVQKELTGIAGSEKGGRAPVLLAFIAHNMGDDAAASKNLDDATTRGGYTGLVEEMRAAWGMKTSAK